MFIFAIALHGCGAGSDTGADGACSLPVLPCPECSDGLESCGYAGVEVVSPSCGDCQARSGLYAALCAAGSTDSAADIEAGAVCEPVTCDAVYDCSCTPECRLSNVDFTASCESCPTQEPPPGECGWTGDGCDWQ